MTDTQGPLRTTVVQFGAGGIGRGFAAPLFCEAGRETLFVDVDADLVAALNERRAYPLALLGPHRREERTVGPVRALHAGDAPAVVRELARCEFAATAVGVGILPRLAATLAAGVRTRRAAGAGPLDVILCENQLHCAEGLWEALRPELTAAEAGSLGLVESAVGRTVPLVSPEQRARDPLWIAADDYPHLIAARAGFRGLVPAVPGLRVVEDLQPYADRKLLGHNMAHAVAAYLGAAAGYETVQAALADHEIAECVGRALDAVAPALARRHGFAPEEMRAWRADLDLRLRNPQLPDAIARVGRDPLRKLGPEDRLVGAARLCLAEGVPPDPILVGIAAALRYAAATEGEHPAVRLLASDPQEAVRRLTGQGPETALGQAICRMQAETPARSFAPG